MAHTATARDCVVRELADVCICIGPLLSAGPCRRSTHGPQRPTFGQGQPVHQYSAPVRPTRASQFRVRRSATSRWEVGWAVQAPHISEGRPSRKGPTLGRERCSRPETRRRCQLGTADPVVRAVVQPVLRSASDGRSTAPRPMERATTAAWQWHKKKQKTVSQR